MAELKPVAAERGGLRLFTIFGIEIRLDFSVVIIFGLIVYSLAAGLFPQWHPEWATGVTWGTAFAAGIMFFASLLAHELSHSLTARRFGIRVPRITLFLFGGVAEIESEAETPTAEFTIAIAGPLMSAALGLAFMFIVSASLDEQTLAQILENPEEGMAGLSPVMTACLWLGSVNMMLAIFNLIPGFPLDGGRVFRALIWRATGDHLLATRMASTAGKWFGWTIMGIGLWNLLVLKSLGGLWLVLIGWFLSHLASASYAQLLTQRSLRTLRVGDVMRTRFDQVPADVSVERFIEDYLLRSSQLLWPVIDQGRVLGTLSFSEASAIPVAERPRRLVTDVMSGLGSARVLDANTMASSALTSLLQTGDEPVAVVSGGRVVGLIRGSDILRWVTVHQDRTAR
mgnify:FL=1